MTSTPLSRYLDLLKADIIGGLVSVKSFSKIEKIAAGIPGALVFSPFGFECPLGVEEGVADFLFSLTKDNSGPEILAGELPEHDFNGSFFQVPHLNRVWHRVRRFGKRWADPRAHLYHSIDNVWLELDIASGTQEGMAAPSLFFAPFAAENRFQGTLSTPKEGLRPLEAVFFCLKGRAPKDSIRRNWEKCLGMLSRLTNLFQVGYMIARSDSDTLRMCITVPDGTTLKRYLAHVNWPGDFGRLDFVLQKISPLFPTLYLHVDVGTEVSGKIGIECKFPYHRGPSREPRWHPFLDFLLKAGCCVPEKKKALLAYPGYGKTPENGCPRALAEMAERRHPLYRSYFVRTIYHVKLVLTETGNLEAKAYMGVNHLWKGVRPEESKRGRGPWGIIG